MRRNLNTYHAKFLYVLAFFILIILAIPQLSYEFRATSGLLPFYFLTFLSLILIFLGFMGWKTFERIQIMQSWIISDTRSDQGSHLIPLFKNTTGFNDPIPLETRKGKIDDFLGEAQTYFVSTIKVSGGSNHSDAWEIYALVNTSMGRGFFCIYSDKEAFRDQFVFRHHLFLVDDIVDIRRSRWSWWGMEGQYLQLRSGKKFRFFTREEDCFFDQARNFLFSV
jgi:hypothetical protein